MSYQITVFDLLDTPEWTNMTLKQIAAYISSQTGLNFIPDTRWHGEYNEYIAYHTSKLFFTLGLDNYDTFDEAADALLALIREKLAEKGIEL